MTLTADEALATVENVLRDLLVQSLERENGADWVNKLVDPETLARWEARREEERNRRKAARIDERLVYYSELAELGKLLDKHWQHFSKCLGKWKSFEPDLNRLITFRHAQRHGRDLVQFEVDLLRGIVGEIRNKVTIYRSEMRHDPELFPHIEYVSDSYGNVGRQGEESVTTGLVLHPGDEVAFTCRGWDPAVESVRWN